MIGTGYNGLDASLRGPSQGLWGKVPWDHIVSGLVSGICRHEDFDEKTMTNQTLTNWIITQSTTGTVASVAGYGGLMVIDPGASTQYQGLELQHGYNAAQQASIVPAAGRKIALEARVAISTITNGPDFFMGLHIPDTTIMVNGVINLGETESLCGFYTSDTIANLGAGTFRFAASKQGAEKLDYAAGVFVAATYIKLGFLIDELKKIEIYVNGTKAATDVAAAYIPALGMTPSIVHKASGTGQPTGTYDWIRWAEWDL